MRNSAIWICVIVTVVQLCNLGYLIHQVYLLCKDNMNLLLVCIVNPTTPKKINRRYIYILSPGCPFLDGGYIATRLLLLLFLTCAAFSKASTRERSPTEQLKMTSEILFSRRTFAGARFAERNTDNYEYANCRNTGSLAGDIAETYFVLFMTKIEYYII